MKKIIFAILISLSILSYSINLQKSVEPPKVQLTQWKITHVAPHSKILVFCYTETMTQKHYKIPTLIIYETNDKYSLIVSPGLLMDIYKSMIEGKASVVMVENETKPIIR